METPYKYRKGSLRDIPRWKSWRNSAHASRANELSPGMVPLNSMATEIDDLDLDDDLSFFQWLKLEHEWGFSLPWKRRLKPSGHTVHFLSVPFTLEPLLSFGHAMCFDMFLFHFTSLPIRCCSGLFSLILVSTYSSIHFLSHLTIQFGFRLPLFSIIEDILFPFCKRFPFRRAHSYDLIKASVICLVVFLLGYIQVSRVYHYIRGEAVIKLYVIFNILEIFDRLLCSLGSDILDSLYRISRDHATVFTFFSDISDKMVESSESATEQNRAREVSPESTSNVSKTKVQDDELLYPYGYNKSTNTGSSPASNPEITSSHTRSRLGATTSVQTVNEMFIPDLTSFSRGSRVSSGNSNFPSSSANDIVSTGVNLVATTLNPSFFHPFSSFFLPAADVPHPPASNGGAIYTNMRLLANFLIAATYTLIHALVLFLQIVCLNVALNSRSNSLLTLLVSNNFVELKGSVFKKFEAENLFQIACADAVERFQQMLFLSLIAFQETDLSSLSSLLFGPSGGASSSDGISPSGGQYPLNSGNVFSGFGVVMEMLSENLVGMLPGMLAVACAEIVVDYLKHSFICKFNRLHSDLYISFTSILSHDLVAVRARIGTSLDPTHAISKRLGLAVVPMSVIALRMVLLKLNASSSSAGFLPLVSKFIFAVPNAFLAFFSLGSVGFHGYSPDPMPPLGVGIWGMLSLFLLPLCLLLVKNASSMFLIAKAANNIKRQRASESQANEAPHASPNVKKQL